MSTTRRSPATRSGDCPCTGATLDRLIQPAVLTILAQKDLHGYRIAQRIADLPPFEGRRPDASGVYRSLRSMEGRGLVEASWDVSERGPARRLYRLTSSGRQCLCRWIEALEHYREAIGSLLTTMRRASAAAGEQQADPKPSKTRKG